MLCQTGIHFFTHSMDDIKIMVYMYQGHSAFLLSDKSRIFLFKEQIVHSHLFVK